MLDSTPFLGRGLLTAESLAQQADELLRQGLLLPATMTARAAIEMRLRELARDVGLRRMTGRNPRKARVNSLATFLMGKVILSRQQWQETTRLYDRLSKLSHGTSICFDDAQQLLLAARQLIESTTKGGGA